MEKSKHVIIEDDCVFVNCYRIKLETDKGKFRIYCFNSEKGGGDTEIIFEGKLEGVTLSTERQGFKNKQILGTLTLNPTLRKQKKRNGKWKRRWT